MHREIYCLTGQMMNAPVPWVFLQGGVEEKEKKIELEASHAGA